MSTLTTRWSLKRNDGADPFLRQDFVDNWNKLDAAPGLHVCTSSSRPTWGADQAGRCILEADTRRTVEWTGSAWLPVLNGQSAWVVSAAPNQVLASGAAATYTLGSITTTQPGNLLVTTQVALGSAADTPQGANGTGYVDGVARAAGQQGLTQWAGGGGATAYGDYRSFNCFSVATVTAGAHTIGLRVQVGTLSAATVLAFRMTAIVVLANNGGN